MCGQHKHLWKRADHSENVDDEVDDEEAQEEFRDVVSRQTEVIVANCLNVSGL